MKKSLSEMLRPQELADLAQPVSMVRKLERMVADGKLLNMLFYGSPGVGKTSAARVLFKKLDAEPLEINGSIETGVSDVRDVIVNYCSHLGLFGKYKVCFIDECEYLSANAQAALRGVIEQYPNVAFVMTANDISKLHRALKSRCMPICFDPNPLEAMEIINRLMPRYKSCVAEYGIQIDDKTLRDILLTAYPDFRWVANLIEFEAMSRAA